MKVEWDYTSLADAYLKRPDYSPVAIEALLSIAKADSDSIVCDVGAGVAHLTLMLATSVSKVFAIEPNDAMRLHGSRRTEQYPGVYWSDGTGEATGQDSKKFDLVTFGSSFNVCNRDEALKEVVRILKPNGWFACMWNHRQLDDEIQENIENIIKFHVNTYGYGVRREDQANVIHRSGFFGSVIQLNAKVIHKQSVDECVEAWRSHATLARQAESNFERVIDEIQNYLGSLGVREIEVPYATNIWMAKLK